MARAGVGAAARDSALLEEPRDVGGQQIVDQSSLLDVEDLDLAAVLAVDESKGADAQSKIPRVVALKLPGVAVGKRKQGRLAASPGLGGERRDVVPDRLRYDNGRFLTGKRRRGT